MCTCSVASAVLQVHAWASLRKMSALLHASFFQQQLSEVPAAAAAAMLAFADPACSFVL